MSWLYIFSMGWKYLKHQRRLFSTGVVKKTPNKTYAWTELSSGEWCGETYGYPHSFTQGCSLYGLGSAQYQANGANIFVGLLNFKEKLTSKRYVWQNSKSQVYTLRHTPFIIHFDGKCRLSPDIWNACSKNVYTMVKKHEETKYQVIKSTDQGACIIDSSSQTDGARNLQITCSSFAWSTEVCLLHIVSDHVTKVITNVKYVAYLM